MRKLATESLMKLLSSERDAFCECIYLYLATLGKGIMYIGLLGEKPFSIRHANINYVT